MIHELRPRDFEVAQNLTETDEELPEPDRLWIVLVGAAFSLVMGFGWGANGLGNVFATAVGSGVLSTKQAKVAAVGFQVLAYIYIVISSNQIEFINPLTSVYHSYSETSVIIAQLSFIISSAIWVVWTSFMGIPVSSSHCMAGSAMGFVIVIKGLGNMEWENVQTALLSFILTPILAGILALFICYLIDITTMRKGFSNKKLTRTVSIVFLVSSSLSTYGLLYGMSTDFGISPLPLHYSLCASLTVGLIIFLLVLFFIEPMLQAQVEYNQQQRAQEHTPERDEKSFRVNRFKVKKINMLPKKFMISLDGETPITNHINLEGMDKKKEKLSHKLQKYIKSDMDNINEISKFSFGAALYFACGFMAFFQAVENIRISALPLSVLMKIYCREEVNKAAPISPLLASYVTPVICLGIYYAGGAVLKTLATDLGKLNVISGLAAQLAVTGVVNLASNFNYPHSNSYCLMLAILFVGAVPKDSKTNWKSLKTILVVWLATLPTLIIFVALLSLFFTVVL